MSTSLAYHTQGIVGFQHHSFQYSEGEGNFAVPNVFIVLSMRIITGQDVFRGCPMEV